MPGVLYFAGVSSLSPDKSSDYELIDKIILICYDCTKDEEFSNLVKGVDMTIEVSKNTPVKMTRRDALSQIRKAENLIELARPKSLPHGYEKGSGLITLWFISLGGSISSLPVLLHSIYTNDYLTVAISSIVGIFSVACTAGIPFTQTREIEFFNKKGKFCKLLQLLFLDRKLKKSVTEALEIIQKNEQMHKIHQVLIDKVVEELESSGVMGVVNDFSDPENDSFVVVNRESGHFRYLSRKEIEKEAGIEPDPLHEYQRLVSEVVSSDKLLADKDFRELFR